MHLLRQSGLGLICGLAVAAFTAAASAQLTPAPADDPLGPVQPAADDGGNSDEGLLGTLAADDFGGDAGSQPPDDPDLDFDDIGSPFPLCSLGLLFGSGGALVGLIAIRVGGCRRRGGYGRRREAIFRVTCTPGHASNGVAETWTSNGDLAK